MTAPHRRRPYLSDWIFACLGVHPALSEPGRARPASMVTNEATPRGVRSGNRLDVWSMFSHMSSSKGRPRTYRNQGCCISFCAVGPRRTGVASYPLRRSPRGRARGRKGQGCPRLWPTFCRDLWCHRRLTPFFHSIRCM